MWDKLDGKRIVKPDIFGPHKENSLYLFYKCKNAESSLWGLILGDWVYSVFSIKLTLYVPIKHENPTSVCDDRPRGKYAGNIVS